MQVLLDNQELTAQYTSGLNYVSAYVHYSYLRGFSRDWHKSLHNQGTLPPESIEILESLTEGDFINYPQIELGTWDSYMSRTKVDMFDAAIHKAMREIGAPPPMNIMCRRCNSGVSIIMFIVSLYVEQPI